jgi:hypothetical protein
MCGGFPLIGLTFPTAHTRVRCANWPAVAASEPALAWSWELRSGPKFHTEFDEAQIANKHENRCSESNASGEVAVDVLRGHGTHSGAPGS